MVPAVLLALFSAGAVAGTAMAPKAVGEMAVVFPPLTDEITAWAIIRQAGGLIVSPTQLSNIVVAYAPDDQFQTRVRELGALFFVAAKGICGPVAVQDA